MRIREENAKKMAQMGPKKYEMHLSSSQNSRAQTLVLSFPRQLAWFQHPRYPLDSSSLWGIGSGFSSSVSHVSEGFAKTWPLHQKVSVPSILRRTHRN